MLVLCCAAGDSVLGHCIWTTWECVGTILCIVVILCHGLAWLGIAIDDMCVYVLTFLQGELTDTHQLVNDFLFDAKLQMYELMITLHVSCM